MKHPPEKYFEIYEKEYRKFIPPFYQGKIYKVDVIPLISFFRIYQQSNEIYKFRQKIYLDTDTGYLTFLMDPRGFFKSVHFYVGYFTNRREGKRYIFGLRGDKPILCAIQTHVSCRIKEQKHKITQQYLFKSKVLLKQKYYHEKYLDQRRIDKFVFTVNVFENIRRFFPRWYYYYKLAFRMHVFWKFN